MKNPFHKKVEMTTKDSPDRFDPENKFLGKIGDIRRMSPSALVEVALRDNTEVNITDYIYSRAEDEEGNPLPQYYSIKIFNSDTRIVKGLDVDVCFFSELFKKQGDKNLLNFIQDIIHIYKEVNKL